MFYVKEKINSSVSVRIGLHYDNVFCICPECGCEVRVNLAKLFINKDADLYNAVVYCKECSKMVLKNMNKDEYLN